MINFRNYLIAGLIAVVGLTGCDDDMKCQSFYQINYITKKDHEDYRAIKDKIVAARRDKVSALQTNFVQKDILSDGQKKNVSYNEQKNTVEHMVKTKIIGATNNTDSTKSETNVVSGANCTNEVNKTISLHEGKSSSTSLEGMITDVQPHSVPVWYDDQSFSVPITFVLFRDSSSGKDYTFVLPNAAGIKKTLVSISYTPVKNSRLNFGKEIMAPRNKNFKFKGNWYIKTDGIIEYVEDIKNIKEDLK